MTLEEAVDVRHSVRQYVDKPIDEEKRQKLSAFVDDINQESGLHIQLVYDERKAFAGGLASYGKFKGVSNYIALVGKKSKDLEEKIGYYGEKIVLYAKTLGLNTCWVALTFKNIKSAYQVKKGEKFLMVISLGYGVHNGFARKSKKGEEVSKEYETAPKWFRNGVDFALKAPTAINQQKFAITLSEENKVKIKAIFGPYSKVDLGIVKLHFELGAGKENFTWVD